MSKVAKQNILNRDCIKPVKKRRKLGDAECSGFYVSLSPTAPPTFSLKYTCPRTRERLTHRLGIYQAGGDGIEKRDVAYWRVEAMKVKVRIAKGEDIAGTTKRAQQAAAKQAITVDELIDLRIEWMSEMITERRQTEQGWIVKRKPRVKDHANMAAHLNRYIRPRLGPMIASEVTNDDIAQLQIDILEKHMFVRKRRPDQGPPNSPVRHMRKAASGLFNWAAEAGRKYINASPCVNLPEMPKEPPRKRKLSHEEIRTLWHGLDRPDMPIDRKICLALKFALASSLRSIEFLHIHQDELQGRGLNDPKPLVIIPEERVKKAREIHQPLSDLAVEIAREAMGNYPWMFAGRFGTEPLNRKAMACALRGKTKRVKGKVVIESEGICRFLGMRPFTPHDLRRTAASLMGSIKVPRSIIALCLDHVIKADEFGDVSAVTGVYDTDQRIDEKREALQKLADEIRRIISTPMEADEQMRQAA